MGKTKRVKRLGKLDLDLFDASKPTDLSQLGKDYQPVELDLTKFDTAKIVKWKQND